MKLSSMAVQTLLAALGMLAMVACSGSNEDASASDTPTSSARPSATAKPGVASERPLDLQGLEGRIAFVTGPVEDSNRSGAISVINADGSGFFELTGDSVAYHTTRWSPDGRSIAFLSGDEDTTILVVQGDGSNLRTVADRVIGNGPNTYTWSPDSTKIAFSRQVYGGAYSLDREQLYAVEVTAQIGGAGDDRSGIKQISDDRVLSQVHPAWSPNGERLAYAGFYGEIGVINADGSGATTLVEGVEDGVRAERSPVWSPDGSQIAFVPLVDDPNRGENRELYVVNSDGTGLRRLTNKAGDESQPVWSPDGSQIAFVADGDGDEEVYVVAADGSVTTRLTDNYDAFDFAPAWSPDGHYIVYVSNRYDFSSVAESDLYIMRADGSAKSNLTNSPETFEGSPSWTAGN
jgi:Tol biopolymer transport system component